MKFGFLLEDAAKVFSDPVIIAAMIFAALGVALALIAKKITLMVRKTQTIDPKDKLYLYLKVAGLGLILLGFILLIIAGASAIV